MTKQEIGAILKELRLNKGMTQQQVADTIGRKQQIIGHWETGYSQPDANTLFELCDLYDVTVDEAFGFKKSDKNILHASEHNTFSLDEFAKQKGATALELEIMKIYFSIDPNTRKDLLNKFKLAVLEDENLNQDNEEEDLVQTLPDEILRDIEWAKLNKENLQNKSNTDMEVKNKDA